MLERIAQFPKDTPLAVVGPVLQLCNPLFGRNCMARKLHPALTRPDLAVLASFENFIDLRQIPHDLKTTVDKDVSAIARLRALTADDDTELGVVFMLNFGEVDDVLAIYRARDISVYLYSVIDVAGQAIHSISRKTNYAIGSAVSSMAGYGRQSEILDRLSNEDFGWPEAPSLPPSLVHFGGARTAKKNKKAKKASRRRLVRTAVRRR